MTNLDIRRIINVYKIMLNNSPRGDFGMKWRKYNLKIKMLFPFLWEMKVEGNVVEIVMIIANDVR